MAEDERITYAAYKEAWNAEIQALPIHWAFGPAEIAEICERAGVPREEVVETPIAVHAFAFERDMPEVEAFMRRPDDFAGLMEDPEFAEEAFYDEMCLSRYRVHLDDARVIGKWFALDYAEANLGYEAYLEQCGYGYDVKMAYARALARYLHT